MYSQQLPRGRPKSRDKVVTLSGMGMEMGMAMGMGMGMEIEKGMEMAIVQDTMRSR